MNIEEFPYPICFNTVDVMILDGAGGVILARKPNERLWRCVGGFMDPGETRLEAAQRELKEETGNFVDSSKFFQILETPIKDKRYANSKHGITTTLFSCVVENSFSLTPSDDIAELKRFNMAEVLKNIDSVIVEEHRVLFEGIKGEYFDANKNVSIPIPETHEILYAVSSNGKNFSLTRGPNVSDERLYHSFFAVLEHYILISGEEKRNEIVLDTIRRLKKSIANDDKYSMEEVQVLRQFKPCLVVSEYEGMFTMSCKDAAESNIIFNAIVSALYIYATQIEKCFNKSKEQIFADIVELAKKKDGDSHVEEKNS